MRWPSRFLVLLIVCLIATAVPAAPAQAECVPWDIELSPESGPPGTEVTVYGHDFEANEFVDLYYDVNGDGDCTRDELISEGTRTNLSGGFTIAFTIPEGCSGYYRVHADVRGAKADAYFAVKPGLTVSPEKGPVGTNVTLKGGGFAKNEQGIEVMFYLNDSYETIERNVVANALGSWELSFQILSSTRGEHKIDAQGVESKHYQVQDAIFRVTAEISIDKSSGIVGNTITMTGSRFATSEKDIRILFDGEAVVTGIKADAQGEWEQSFKVPEMPTGEYSITAEGEQTAKEDIGELSFELEPNIVLSETEGHVGMNLTVTGRGFAASEDVNITYDGNQVATLETNDKGSFNSSFSVPASKYGERLVTAGYAGENCTTATFTMESEPPPIPELISPSNRSRLGFMGEVTPTLEWSEVSDDSGVRYSLQIATNGNVVANGGFADPLISVIDLVETSYALNDTEALSRGTYYWIVQATDGAENEGEWSALHSFRVGLLPLWGLIAAIAGAVVLLVILIRALVIRRTIYYDRW